MAAFGWPEHEISLPLVRAARPDKGIGVARDFSVIYCVGRVFVRGNRLRNARPDATNERHP